MATPMSYISDEEFMCCQCFSRVPVDEATFDMYSNTVKLTRVDVCMPCRMAETYWMIKKFCGYEGLYG